MSVPTKTTSKRHHDDSNDSLDNDHLNEARRDKKKIDDKPDQPPKSNGASISGPCRSDDLYEKVGKIGEGTYGAVYKARCNKTKRLVAMKKLKLEGECEGFPANSIREVITLLKGRHPNVIEVIEIVFGKKLDQIYIVMEYMDRDLKSLMHDMKRPFQLAEIKLLMKQLLSAIKHLHDNWIIHRDIKPSNLLINKGRLKLGDFGLAREYCSPIRGFTNNVVTLWYRAIELLLNTGQTKYSTPIDMWSIGCIFGELFTGKPLFPGNTEQEQIELIFRTLGSPNDETWPDYDKIRLYKKLNFSYQPPNDLRNKLSDKNIITKNGLHLWKRLLAYDPGVKPPNQENYEEKPSHRIKAGDALKHPFFTEEPRPVHQDLFLLTSLSYS